MLRKHGMTSEQIAEVLEIPLDTIQNYLKAE
jgi:DNA-directed RNA polymerase specialized sigma24 family protein